MEDKNFKKIQSMFVELNTVQTRMETIAKEWGNMNIYDENAKQEESKLNEEFEDLKVKEMELKEKLNSYLI